MCVHVCAVYACVTLAHMLMRTYGVYMCSLCCALHHVNVRTYVSCPYISKHASSHCIYLRTYVPTCAQSKVQCINYTCTLYVFHLLMHVRILTHVYVCTYIHNRYVHAYCASSLLVARINSDL